MVEGAPSRYRKSMAGCGSCAAKNGHSPPAEANRRLNSKQRKKTKKRFLVTIGGGDMTLYKIAVRFRKPARYTAPYGSYSLRLSSLECRTGWFGPVASHLTEAPHGPLAIRTAFPRRARVNLLHPSNRQVSSPRSTVPGNAPSLSFS